MKIVSENQESVFLIENDQVFIINESFRRALLINGISIPLFFRDQFGGKTKIYPQDKLFSKALLEVYYPFCLKEGGFFLELC